MPEVYLADGDFFFEVGNRDIPIKEGFIITKPQPYGPPEYDWQIHVQAKHLPINRPFYRLLYDDKSLFLTVEVHEAFHEGNNHILRLKPYIEPDDLT